MVARGLYGGLHGPLFLAKPFRLCLYMDEGDHVDGAGIIGRS